MNFRNVVPLSSFCAFKKQEGKAKESCKNHERLQWELCRKDIWEQKPRYLGNYGGSMRTNKEKDARSEKEKESI